MVCYAKSGIMATLARLLAAGSVSQTLAEEVDYQTLTAKYLLRELRRADESNLLDEEDMHMFGLRPMADPLYLVCDGTTILYDIIENEVCCNACKKPIKASHYAAHAELCNSLNYTEEIASEVNGTSGRKKLRRKYRKKLQIAHATTTVREQENFESQDSEINTAPGSKFQEELQMIHLAEAKRSTNCVKETARMNSLKVSPANMEHSETLMPSPPKLVKRTISEIQSCHGVKTPCITHEDVLQCQELLTVTNQGSKEISNSFVGNQTSDEFYESLVSRAQRVFGLWRGFHCNHGSQNQFHAWALQMWFSITFDGSILGVAISDAPAPLATKIYYSQRNHYLRRVISHMYYAESRKEKSNGGFTSEDLQVISEQTQSSSPSNLYHGQADNLQREEHYIHLGQTPDQIPAGNSELYSGKSQGFVPVTKISSPVSVNYTLEPHTSIGTIRSNYVPHSYSFAGRTDNPIGSVQQANGSVPVV